MSLERIEDGDDRTRREGRKGTCWEEVGVKEGIGNE
jgi:hypothetical protein